MNNKIFEENLISLKNQRNFLLVICCFFCVSQILISCFLFLKKERLVIVPPIVEKEFWVEAHAISPTYLEQFGTFLGQLLLTKSSYTAESQKNILLKHVDPICGGAIVERLEKEQSLLAKGNGSYVFYITGVEVCSATNSVLLKGNRMFTVGTKVLSEEKESYLLGFSYKGGRLLLNRLESMSII